MNLNLILAGVGGQGILTIARAVALAAIGRGLCVKQSEVHGMSQRGGAVQAHLRTADHEVYSDQVPVGSADIILALEPMEALRYLHYLSETGVLISNTAPVLNIPDYGPVERVHARIAEYPRHILLDANKLAAAAGSSRAVNVVMLGAASAFIDLAPSCIENAVETVFARKGRSAVDLNLQAFSLGRDAAAAHLQGILRGSDSPSGQHGIGSIPASGTEHC